MATKLSNLVLHELSFVDTPANKHARVTIFKRGLAPGRLDLLARAVKAYYGPSAVGGDDPQGARSFEEIIAEREEQRRESKVNDEFWPVFSALNDSVLSIIADEGVGDDNAKLVAIRHSVEQFMAAVASKVPMADMELTKLLQTNPAAAEVLKAGEAGDPTGQGDPMSKTLETQVAELTNSVADLTKKLEAANAEIAASKAMSAEEKKKFEEMMAARDAAKKALDDLTKAAEVAKTDEAIVVKTGEGDKATTIEVKKSVVGEAQFALLKSQQARLDKAEQDRDLAEFTKRAETEVGSLPGTAVAKGKALKAIGGIADEDTRKALDAMLKAGNAALKGRMAPIGADGAGDSGDAATKLDNLATAYAKENKVNKHVAYDEVLKTAEGRALYTESLGKPKAA